MFKNTASQKLTVFVFDSTTSLPKTGDAANLTAYRDLDDGGVTVLTDTSATEKDATNAKGYYIFDLTQAETNGDKILFSCKSATANMVCIAVPAVVYTLPATGILAPTTAGRTLDVSAGGEAGVDWANVGSQSTAVNLSSTTTNLVNTVTTYTGNTVQTGDTYARLGAPAGASVSADVAAVKVDTAAILVDTGTTLDARIPAALVGGRMDVSVGAMAADVLTAAATAADFTTEIQSGLATAANLATVAGYIDTEIGTILTNLAVVDGIVDDILLDTAEIGTAGAGLTNINLPNQTMDIVGNITGNLSGSVGSVTGAVGSVTGAVGSVTGAVGSVTGLTAANLDAAISTRATPAQVNTEVLDVLNVDTFAQPGQETPAATTTLVKMLSYLYKGFRNRKDTTAAGAFKLYNDDATTVDQKSTLTDDAVTFTTTELTSGP